VKPAHHSAQHSALHSIFSLFVANVVLFCCCWFFCFVPFNVELWFVFLFLMSLDMNWLDIRHFKQYFYYHYLVSMCYS
jgi:hypothetical protein